MVSVVSFRKYITAYAHGVKRSVTVQRHQQSENRKVACIMAVILWIMVVLCESWRLYVPGYVLEILTHLKREWEGCNHPQGMVLVSTNMQCGIGG